MQVQSKRDLRNFFSIDLLCLGALLLFANAPLLFGGPNVNFVFFPAKAASGEWWRIILHPFVHISPLHFFYDGAAFVLLYASLEETSPYKRLAHLAASGAGSLVFSIFFAPQIWTLGLCGMSGVDHGLMAVLGIEMAFRKDSAEKNMGLAVFGVVFIKALLEALTGTPMLETLHFGQMGVPIVVCHLGGVVGGTAAAFALRGKSSGGTDFCMKIRRLG